MLVITTQSVLSEKKIYRVFQTRSHIPTIVADQLNAKYIGWKCRQTNVNEGRLIGFSIWKDLTVKAPDGHVLTFPLLEIP